MILQALTRLYEDMADRGDIARQGWGPAKISYALCIDGDGRLTQILPLIKEEHTGKKTVLRPRIMELPAAVKRAVNILSNFLWDNSSYCLALMAKASRNAARNALTPVQSCITIFSTGRIRKRRKPYLTISTTGSLKMLPNILPSKSIMTS